MRLAVLTHNYPRFPGDFSGNFVAALSDELARQGQRVSVLAPWDAAYRPQTYPLGPTAPALRPDLQPGRAPLILWRYAPRDDWHRLGYMRTMEADVRMRGETYWLAPMFFAAGAAATLRWCRQHRPDVIHAHWLLPNGFFGAVASRALGHSAGGLHPRLRCAGGRPEPALPRHDPLRLAAGRPGHCQQPRPGRRGHPRTGRGPGPLRPDHLRRGSGRLRPDPAA
jgi:hypothetical protein